MWRSTATWLARGIVDDLAHELVRALAGGVAADDIGKAFFGRAVDADKPVRILHPADLLQPGAIIRKRKISDLFRRWELLHPFRQLLRVKDRLACDAPLAQAVDRIVIRVGGPVGFQHLGLAASSKKRLSR